MFKLFRVDFYHMFYKKWFWIFTAFMVASAVGFCAMQYTAMDYVVALDRVIFLPMAFFGIAAAALVGMVIGEDFSDGIVKNKMISGKSRASVYFANLVASTLGCILMYLFTIMISYGMGIHLFENNVPFEKLLLFICLGFVTICNYAAVYCMVTMIVGNKSLALMFCMGIAFVLLFLSIHVDGMLARPEMKDGQINPFYVGGLKRTIYEWIHDINPTGQAAQLSQMECLFPVRYAIAALLSILLCSLVGYGVFCRKDIK